MPTTGTTPTSSGSTTNRQMVVNLKAIAAKGLLAGEPRDVTIATMTAYVLSVKSTTTRAARSLAVSAYAAVKNKPTSVWSELVNNPIASWQAGIDNVVAPFKTMLEAITGIFGALTSGALWMRVLFVIGGIALLFVGFNLLIKEFGIGAALKAVTK